MKDLKIKLIQTKNERTVNKDADVTPSKTSNYIPNRKPVY